jgi:hypothetical protein
MRAGGRRFRRGVRIAAVLGVITLGQAPGPASAQPFGPGACSGACYYADNSNHTYFNNGLSAGDASSMNFAMLTRLQSTDMTVDQFQSWNNDTDVVAYDDNYGNTTWWGLWRCEVLVSGSSTKCNRGSITFNLYHGEAWTSLACQEVGHSVGLDHSTLTDSCMQQTAGTANDFDAHDRSHINGYY